MRGRIVLTGPGVDAPGLDSPGLDALLAAAGLPGLRPIGPAAAEIADLADGAREAAQAAVADRAIDVAFRPTDAPAPRLFLADMDSTIIGCECVDEIADFAGVKPQVAAITEAAMRGELDFEGALRERVALLRGLPAAALQDVFDQRVRLNPGAAELVRTLAAHGVETALVSGGFTFFTERVAAAAGFARHQANTLEIEDGLLTGRVGDPILGRAAKRVALERLAAEIGAPLSAAIAVGDGANDLDMVSAAGLGVAYRAKPALAEAADARLDHSDLTAILHLAGVPVG